VEHAQRHVKEYQKLCCLLGKAVTKEWKACIYMWEDSKGNPTVQFPYKPLVRSKHLFPVLVNVLKYLTAIPMDELCKQLEDEEQRQEEQTEHHLGVLPIEFRCLGFRLEKLQ
jgi:hypothetical protein